MSITVFVDVDTFQHDACHQYTVNDMSHIFIYTYIRICIYTYIHTYIQVACVVLKCFDFHKNWNKNVSGLKKRVSGGGKPPMPPPSNTEMSAVSTAVRGFKSAASSSAVSTRP